MPRLRRYPLRGPRHTDPRQRILAATVTGMLLTAQVLAAIHFVFVPHTIDARTSKVVPCREPHQHSSAHKPSRCPDNGAPEGDDPSPQECQVLALLQQAQTLTSPAATIQTSTTIEIIVTPDKGMTVHSRIRVYQVSPAQSPPPSTFC